MGVYFYIDGIYYYSTQDKLIMTLMIVKNNKLAFSWYITTVIQSNMSTINLSTELIPIAWKTEILNILM